VERLPDETGEKGEKNRGLRDVPFLQCPAWIDPVGLAAFACGSVGLLCASLTRWTGWTLPLAFLGVGLGLLGLVLALVTRRLARGLWSLAGTAVALGTLVVALCAPALFGNPAAWADRTRPAPAKPAGIQAVPIGTEKLLPAEGDDRWIDASKNAAQLNDLRVRVLSAEVRRLGSVQNPVVRLVLHMQVSNVAARRRLEYHGWGPADAPGGPGVTLTDTEGRSYRLRQAGEGKEAERESMPLSPARRILDVLVFDNPPATADPLFLELLSPVGGESATFRFRIPRAMIVKR
jgi:hypothetical protein